MLVELEGAGASMKNASSVGPTLYVSVHAVSGFGLEWGCSAFGWYGGENVENVSERQCLRFELWLMVTYM